MRRHPDAVIAAVLFGGALVLFGLISAYYTFLHAPAAVAARPALAGLGFWTALFSGRFQTWLFYHEPLVGAGLLTAFWFILAAIAWWTA